MPIPEYKCCAHGEYVLLDRFSEVQLIIEFSVKLFSIRISVDLLSQQATDRL